MNFVGFGKLLKEISFRALFSLKCDYNSWGTQNYEIGKQRFSYILNASMRSDLQF